MGFRNIRTAIVDFFEVCYQYFISMKPIFEVFGEG